MRTLQRESNEVSYWWLDGEAPKNTSRNVGQGQWFTRSCQTLRGVSQEAPIRNVNLWTIVLDHNATSKKQGLVREVQDGWTQTRQYCENPGKNTKCRKKANFQPFYQKVCGHKTEEIRRAKLQDHSDHRQCQRMLARWLRRDWRRRKEDSVPHHQWLFYNIHDNKKFRNTAGLDFLSFPPRSAVVSFRAMYGRYRQQLLFHRPPIK